MLPNKQIVDSSGQLTSQWLQYLSRMFGIAESQLAGSHPDNGRPIPAYVGQAWVAPAPGSMPIFAKTTGPGAVWVNAAGVEV